jgi:hypothetical protein
MVPASMRRAMAARSTRSGSASPDDGCDPRTRFGRSERRSSSPEAYRLGRESLGEAGYVATQMASILGENRVKLVPDIAVGGDGSTRLADVLIGKMLAGSIPDASAPAGK